MLPSPIHTPLFWPYLAFPEVLLPGDGNIFFFVWEYKCCLFFFFFGSTQPSITFYTLQDQVLLEEFSRDVK